MACGLGAFSVAIFHLLAHGCYKAFFFLSTGNALRSVEPGQRHGDHEHHASEGMGTLYVGALLLALIPPFVLFSGSYEYLWGITGFVSAAIGFKIIGLITVFVAAQYLFKSVTSLFSQGPKTYWPQDSLETQSVRPQFFNGSILTCLFLATIFVGWLMTLFWSWFADFLAPVLTFPGVTLGESAVEHGFSFWLVVSLGVAVAGWVYAYSTQMRSQDQVSRAKGKSSRLYVLFWNKGYFDEIYDAYLVNPMIRFANWLWRIIDIRVIDKFIYFIASYSVYFARWLWRIIDIRWLEQKVGQLVVQVDAEGELSQGKKFRTLHHQLLVIIFWLVALTGLLYASV